jgi:hypothetical protein
MRAKHRNAKTKVLDFPVAAGARDVARSSPPQMPAIAPAAVWSFLKETRGQLSWTAKQLIDTLKISTPEAEGALAILKMQGYIQPGDQATEWITSPAGEEISGSKMPHYRRESVNRVLVEFTARIKAAAEDSKAPFKVAQAVAFGDFLSKHSRVQAPDVGVEVVHRNERNNSVAPTSAEIRSFLKQLKGKSSALNVRPFESWMGERMHRKLF